MRQKPKYQARIQGGGGWGGARPPLFVPNSLKSPVNWPKKSRERAPEAPAPPPLSNLGSAPECPGYNY